MVPEIASDLRGDRRSGSTSGGARAAGRWLALVGWLLFGNSVTLAAAPESGGGGDRGFTEYFRRETRQLQEATLRGIVSWSDWEQRRGEYRRQLREMLGLDPLPERRPLQAVVTRQTTRDGICVENVHFQSLPGLYVTGNLYRPAEATERSPAVLYVCGHGGVKKNGISYGNKVHYQHHGAWLARHGYVCLIIDSLQLGEIEATHHGTHHLGQWWWWNRGYTPAGVEAWNCIRALDYLESRPEVDATRLGVTGRSGGGAYSWWIAALDDRIQVAVPVAGITDLQNHVVDGCVADHCDCMYFVNTYRWDYPQLSALVAPRPLLLANTDRDPIFPLDGVIRTYQQTGRLYELAKAGPRFGLNITAGPHQDTQELQTHAFRWFDAHLAGRSRLLDEPATPRFQPDELRVFSELPADQRNTTIHDTFVPVAAPPLPRDAAELATLAANWRQTLVEKSFRGWPAVEEPLAVAPAGEQTAQGVRLQAYDFTSQSPFRLRLYVAQRADLEKADLLVLNVLDDTSWREFLATFGGDFATLWAGESLPPVDPQAATEVRQMLTRFPWAMAYVAPRGVGPTALPVDEKTRTHLLRRFYLLGQTLESMQVWDVRRARQALRDTPWKETPLWLQSERQMAGVTLYAGLFTDGVQRFDLHRLPESHRSGPVFLNVQRFLDLPQAVTLAASQARVVIYQEQPAAGWEYPRQVARQLNWNQRLDFRALPQEGMP